MTPTHYQASEFGFDRSRISRAALQVVEGLHAAGYDGYLVGGCVRDLLLGKEPKDFDVTTNATPEEVKRIFERARIIGRRFRLVHVRFRGETIEVATYRADPNRSGKKKWFKWSKKQVPNSGRITDDNVYGDIEDDAIRRDFTVNALYYDPTAEQVIDYLGGVADINERCLKMIGKPEERFAEDPVRMLRVIRFKAKLGLEPEALLMASIHKHRQLLEGVPAARLFDEVLKLFHHAHGVNSWHELRETRLAELLFDHSVEVMEHEGGDKYEQLIQYALENTDRRIAQDKPVIPAFLFAVVLWGPFSERYRQLSQGSRNTVQAMHQASDEVFAAQCLQVSVPRRVSTPSIEIWELQGTLERRRPRTIRSILENRRFRAGYDFLLLRARIGEVDQELVDWWTRIQDLDNDGRGKMIGELSPDKSHRRSRKRRSPRKRKSTPGNSSV
ncbi:MAG: polynucleotide adenylyltransferase PcnB [bacterium]